MGADVKASFSLSNNSPCSAVQMNFGRLGANGGSLTLARFLVVAIGSNQVVQWAGPF